MKSSNSDIIIFSGPTITAAEILEILPDAKCHLPVKCGDIFRVLRLIPKILVIIDGYFEQTASVWHKEILFSLSKGVHVYGAGSMGALRAAELDQFGMIGFGEIYQYYRQDNEVVDDDEVALTHSTSNECQTNIIPLINIRFTLEKAIACQLLDRKKADDVIREIKKIPYFQRNFKLLEKKVNDTNIFLWIKENYVDQKRLDAIKLLECLSRDKQDQKKVFLNMSFHSTFFIRKLYREIMSSPFEKCYEWLPDEEKKLCNYQCNASPVHLKILSKLMHIMYDILMIDVEYNSHGENDYNQLLKFAMSMTSIERARYCFRFYSAYSDDNVIYQKNNMLYVISVMLAALVDYSKIKNIEISEQYQNEFFEKMRRNKKLLNRNETKKWLVANDITNENDYKNFIYVGSIFYYIVVLNNVEYFSINTEMNLKTWLVEALLFYENMNNNDLLLMNLFSWFDSNATIKK